MSQPQVVSQWWVYIVECRDGSLYTGTALDVIRRVALHNAGKGAKYTRARGPVKLVYREASPNRSQACQREFALKQLTHHQKKSLILASLDQTEAL
jgi:predicted GIY-YIG superfamily endonuclease